MSKSFKGRVVTPGRVKAEASFHTVVLIRLQAFKWL